ncbi:MAG: hypothetical protein ACREAD_05135 [Nitrosopumilaceae archaeon]
MNYLFCIIIISLIVVIILSPSVFADIKNSEPKITYQIEGGTIDRIHIEGNLPVIIVNFSMDKDGSITLNIPKKVWYVADSNCKPDHSVVFLDGETPTNYYEQFTDNGRILHFDVPMGHTQEIEIEYGLVLDVHPDPYEKGKECLAVEKPPMSLPLKQFKSGISAKDIQCKESFIIIIKSEKEFPACVSQETAQRLVERNWNLSMNQFVSEEQASDGVIKFRNDTNHYDTRAILGFLRYLTTTDNIPHFLLYTLDENHNAIKFNQTIVINHYNQKYLQPEKIKQFVWITSGNWKIFSFTYFVDSKTGNIIGGGESATAVDRFPQLNRSSDKFSK